VRVVPPAATARLTRSGAVRKRHWLPHVNGSSAVAPLGLDTALFRSVAVSTTSTPAPAPAGSVVQMVRALAIQDAAARGRLRSQQQEQHSEQAAGAAASAHSPPLASLLSRAHFPQDDFWEGEDALYASDDPDARPAKRLAFGAV